MAGDEVILDVQGLDVAFVQGERRIHAVRDVSFQIRRGRVLGIIGESGSGKSTLLLALMQLLAPSAQVTGMVKLGGADLLGLAEPSMAKLRGDRLAMVFQNPHATFNPVFPLASTFIDIQHRAQAASRGEKLRRAVEAFRAVGIADPERAIRKRPNQLSGGMLQRASIAQALMASPDLLLADEPTTALDAANEAQVVALLHDLKTRLDAAVLIVSHQMNVIADLCDDILVMYGGVVVEAGPAGAVLTDPRHPYTRRLLACEPATIVGPTRRLPTIAGEPPDLSRTSDTCPFAPRCHQAADCCETTRAPVTVFSPGHLARCHVLPHEAA